MRVWGSGFGVWGVVFGVRGLGLRIEGPGSETCVRVEVLPTMWLTQNGVTVYRQCGLGFRVDVFEFRVSGLKFRGLRKITLDEKSL